MVFAVPSNCKYRKVHRIKPFSKKDLILENNFFSSKFCDYYLKAYSSNDLTQIQVESVRRAFKRVLKKNIFLKINVFFYDRLTKKPLASRMGKGKGKPYKWVAPIFKGKVLFEFKKIKGISNLQIFRKNLKLLTSKLPVKVKINKLKY